MTAPIKPFPGDATSFASAQEYQNFCKKSMPDFDFGKVLVTNEGTGDSDHGTYHLLFDNPESDYACAAQVNWLSHEMELRLANKSEKKIKDRRFVDMKDTCTFTSQVVGSEEFGGQSCNDGFLEPKLQDATQFESYRYFQNQCQRLIRQAYGSNPQATGPVPTVDPSRVILLNPNPKDDQFSLYYQNLGVDYFCRADISTLQGGALIMTHGKIADKNKAGSDEKLAIPVMTDGCSMTRALVGESDLAVPDCKDKTHYQQDVDRMFGMGTTLLGSGLFYYTMFRLGRKFLFLPIANRVTPWLAPLGRSTATWLTDGAVSLAARVSPRAATFATNLFTRGGTSAVAGAAASRVTFGSVVKGGLISTVLVIGLDQFFEQGVVANKYKNSLNERAAQAVYEQQGLYDYSGWRAVNPFSYLNKTRRIFRAMAPSAMNWAVSRDNPAVVEALYKKDSEDSQKTETFFGEVLPAMFGENEAYRANSLELLKSTITLNYQEITQALLLKTNGAEALKTKFSMTDEQVEALSKKVLLKEVQESAKFLVYVEQPQNDWAREVFNADGTLKAGQEQTLVNYYRPAPFKVADAGVTDSAP